MTAAFSAKEVGAIADEIAHEALRTRARLAFAERLSGLKGLMGEEESIRARVADLQRQADELAVTVAAADDAQTRLDNLETEFATREAALMKRARTDAEEIIRMAWAEAEAAGLDAKRKANEAATLAAEEARRRQADIANLDKTITDRERRLASIEAQIARLRAKITSDD
jgi:hypothetical protein